MKNLIKLGFINDLDANLKASSETQSGLIQVLLGPRQVGKTTSIQAYLDSKHRGKYHYVSADAIFNSDSSWLLEQWQKALTDNHLLVIDEIQKCENWAEVIKKLWDQSRRDKKILQCVLLGSSSLQIQKGLSESLTGRFQLIQAYHWNFAESQLGYNLDFEQYLRFGGYPGSYPFLDSTSWISYVRQSIISTVIEKDILQYQNVKSPALFKQAFEILISYPAQEISYTKLLGQIQDKGNTDLVKYYLSLFEGAYLFKALEKYSEKQIKIKSSSPKILPLAPCLFYLTVLDSYNSVEKGRVFELIVGAQLVRTQQDLFYWREGQHEVDFVLKQGRKLFAIEVKSGRKKKSGGLLHFKERFPQAKTILIDPENYQEFEKDPMAFLETKSF
jgi:predicted AAA+ superfamily ATPase